VAACGLEKSTCAIMQIFKVHDHVLLSRRLSQVANSCSRDSDLFYALPGQQGDNREGGKSGEDR